MSNESAAPAAPGRVHGFFERTRARIRRVKDHPVQGAVYVVVVALAAFGFNEAWSAAKVRMAGEDQYIANLRVQQEQGFRDIKKGLAELRGDGNREVVRDIERAIQTMDKAQGSVVKQLELSRTEVGKLSDALRAAGRPGGGYDFILSESDGFALSETAFLGVDSLYDSWLRANLSSPGAETVSEDLRSGQSIPFRDDRGRACRVVLLRIQDGAASFKVGCK
jgi:hypothetical protein